MRGLARNLAAAAVLLAAWLAEIRFTGGGHALAGTRYLAAWTVWIGGPIVFAVANREAFEGVEGQLRFGLVLFLSALLTVFLYVAATPLVHAYAGHVRGPG